jgi:hypothetical protein
LPQTGTVTVTARSATDPTKVGTINIQLSRGSLNVTAAASRLPPGMTEQFKVDLNGKDYSNVTWSTNVGSINPKNGLYTAPQTLTTNSIATITATSNDDRSLVGSYTLNLTKDIEPIHINCGDWSNPITDANGNVWSTDTGANAGATYHATPFVMTGTEIDGKALDANSPMAPIYNSSRYSSYTPDNQFSYRFNLPDGTYRITLLFGYYGNTPHDALFDVIANGTRPISNYDPDANGLHVGTSQAFTVNVTKKLLTLNFVGRSGKMAEVNGIQIVAQ